MSEQTKTDWRTLPAGIQMDRAIAQRLGWTGIQNVGGELFGHLTQPLGAVMEAVPRYSTDLNATFTLPLETHWYMSITVEHYKGPRSVSVACVPRDNRGLYPAYARDDWKDLALIYCRAWLEHKDIIDGE